MTPLHIHESLWTCDLRSFQESTALDYRLEVTQGEYVRQWEETFSCFHDAEESIPLIRLMMSEDMPHDHLPVGDE